MDPICYLRYFNDLSVSCSLLVTCWERANLLAFMYVMFSFVLSLYHTVSRVRCGSDCIES